MERISSYIFMAAAVLLATASCTKDFPLHMSVSTYEVEFDATGGTRQIEFCFKGNWAEAYEECDWIETKIFISEDDGELKRLSITAEENNTGVPRECEITLSAFREGKKPGSVSERLDRVITVYQDAKIPVGRVNEQVQHGTKL